MAHQQAVNGKVAALHVFLRRLRINHAVRVAAVAVAQIRAERGNFNLETIPRNQNHAELRANSDGLRKKCHHLFGSGVGGHVVVGGLASQEQVAHTSSYEQRLITVAAERVADRVGKFAWCHVVIIRQTGPQREVCVLDSFGGGLPAAKDEAGDVIRLARDADEFIHATHQELKSLL